MSLKFDYDLYRKKSVLADEWKRKASILPIGIKSGKEFTKTII